MLKKIIINADDFGISKGTNIAIIKGSKNGIINSTSIMINVLELNDESKDFLYNADIDLGLHLNLTNEYPVSNPKDIDLLVDKNGTFKNGFINPSLSPFRLQIIQKDIPITIAVNSIQA